jgi:DNA-binding winged helix-turn-helix (wHTH) protein
MPRLARQLRQKEPIFHTTFTNSRAAEREQGDKYIDTLARRGCRFVAKVPEVQNEEVTS